VLAATLSSGYFYIFTPDYIGERKDAEFLIARGWIPDALPNGAYDIHEEHSLDLNIGWGNFRFRESEKLGFRKILAERSSELHPNESAIEIIKDYKNHNSYLVYHGASDGHSLILVDWSSNEGVFYYDSKGYISNGPFTKL